MPLKSTRLRSWRISMGHSHSVMVLAWCDHTALDKKLGQVQNRFLRTGQSCTTHAKRNKIKAINPGSLLAQGAHSPSQPTRSERVPQRDGQNEHVVNVNLCHGSSHEDSIAPYVAHERNTRHGAVDRPFEHCSRPIDEVGAYPEYPQCINTHLYERTGRLRRE
jgi:hypothetical protein